MDDSCYSPVITEINNALSSHGQPEAVKTIILLLKAQTPAGSWEHGGNPLCSAIQTTQAMDALLSIGFEGWIRDQSSPLRIAARWLCDNQHLPQGKWGEDPADTAEVLRILIRIKNEMLAQGIKDSLVEKAIQSGVEYLKKQCAEKDKRFIDFRGFGWYGPAFWANAAVVFHLLGELAIARELIDEIWSFRHDITDTGTYEDGCSFFECPNQIEDKNLRIWNTAHTIVGLVRLTELGPSRYDLSPFVRWLEYQQNCGQDMSKKIKGSWGINVAQIGGDSLSICTYAAIIAIHKAQGTRAPIELGVEWFNRLLQGAREGTDLGNTTLCAAAAMYATVFSAKGFFPFLPLDTVLHITETIGHQSQDIEKLQGELSISQQQYTETVDKLSKTLSETTESRDRLQKEIDGYIFKIHRENLGLWGFIGLALAILSIVIAFILQ